MYTLPLIAALLFIAIDPLSRRNCPSTIPFARPAAYLLLAAHLITLGYGFIGVVSTLGSILVEGFAALAFLLLPTASAVFLLVDYFTSRRNA